jgi:hypothetical protein
VALKSPQQLASISLRSVERAIFRGPLKCLSVEFVTWRRLSTPTTKIPIGLATQQLRGLPELPGGDGEAMAARENHMKYPTPHNTAMPDPTEEMSTSCGRDRQRQLPSPATRPAAPNTPPSPASEAEDQEVGTTWNREDFTLISCWALKAA